MITVTHGTLRRLHPENYGWLVLSYPLPNPYGLDSHEFEPKADWRVSEPTAEAERLYGDVPRTSYADPTGTIHLTVAETDDGLSALLEGEGWMICNGDLHNDGWEDAGRA